jgi:multidrug efflux pump subunit AcrB
MVKLGVKGQGKGGIMEKNKNTKDLSKRYMEAYHHLHHHHLLLLLLLLLLFLLLLLLFHHHHHHHHHHHNNYKSFLKYKIYIKS